MADNEMKIRITATDEATAKIKKAESEINKTATTVKKGNDNIIKGFKDQVKPLNDIIRTVGRVGIIWGVTFGLMIKSVLDLGKEIDKLDKLSIKLGISSSDLSKRIYGFDITTESARLGAASLGNSLSALGTAYLKLKLGIADVIGEAAILEKQGLTAQKGAATTAFMLQTGMPLLAMGEVGPTMPRAEAIAAIEAEQLANRLKSEDGQRLMLVEKDMFSQLTMSKTELARQQFEDQAALMDFYGTDTINIRQAFNDREASDRRMMLLGLAAEQKTIEGDLTSALGFEQEKRLEMFKRTTKDETVIATFAATQQMAMDKRIADAKKQQFQDFATGLSGLSAALAAYAGENKKWAKAAAITAIGSAYVNIAEGITKIWSKYAAVPPVAIALSAIATAAGALQIATISSQSFAEGGRPPVGMASLVGERGPEMFVPDSAGTIIPNNRLGGRHTYITIEINNPVVRNDDDISKLAEEVSLKISMETDRL